MAAPKIRPQKSKLAPLTLVRHEMDETAERLSQKYSLPKNELFNALNTLLVADTIVGDDKPELLFMYSLENLLDQTSNKTLCLEFINSQSQSGIVDLCKGLDAIRQISPLSKKELIVTVNGYRRLHNQENDLAKHGYWNKEEAQLPQSFILHGFHLLLPTRDRKGNTITRSCLFDADSLAQEIAFVESHRQQLLEIRKIILEEITDRLNLGEQIQISFLVETLLSKFNLDELEYLFQTEHKLTEIGSKRGFNFYSGGAHWLVDCYRNFYISTSPTFLKLTEIRTPHFNFDPENLGIGTTLQIFDDNISTLVKNVECDGFAELCDFLYDYGNFEFSKLASDFENTFFSLLRSKDPVTKFVEKAQDYGATHLKIYGDIPDFPRFEGSTQKNEIPKYFTASADFRTVSFHDETFHFSKNQASVIGHLVEEYKKGLLEVNGEKIGEIVGFGETRIDKVFKILKNGKKVPHPAWNKLIGPGQQRGNVRLLFRK